MNENKVKTINGLICKSDLTNIMSSLQKSGKIAYCSTSYRIAHPDYIEKQFYAPFYIEFPSREAWIIFSTNSIRNDRMCIQQWNSEYIKKINPQITKSFVVVPDGEQLNDREKREVERYNEKITSKRIYSSIDGVLLQSQLKSKILGM